MEEKIFLDNFERKKKAIGLIHKVYLAQLKTARKYTACTKTKSEVRGGGRKPWRQKGTGNARAGSTRSPLWVGGGVSFGPKPRVVTKKINKKERRLAILSAFYLKKAQFQFVDENFFTDLNSVKTKDFLKTFASFLSKSNEKYLIILPSEFQQIKLATRNLSNIEVVLATHLNIKQLLNSKHILLSSKSLEIINSTYGKIYN